MLGGYLRDTYMNPYKADKFIKYKVDECAERQRYYSYEAGYSKGFFKG